MWMRLEICCWLERARLCWPHQVCKMMDLWNTATHNLVFHTCTQTHPLMYTYLCTFTYLHNAYMSVCACLCVTRGPLHTSQRSTKRSPTTDHLIIKQPSKQRRLTCTFKVLMWVATGIYIKRLQYAKKKSQKKPNPTIEWASVGTSRKCLTVEAATVISVLDLHAPHRPQLPQTKWIMMNKV